MVVCPNCGEKYSRNVDVCSACYFDFNVWRVVRPEERNPRLKEQKRIQEENLRVAQQEKERVISQSARYEYKTEFLRDSNNGVLNQVTLDSVLARNANDGWKLHSVVVNEAGKNAVSISGFGLNSTVDVTILIFERCVKQGI